MPPSHDSAHANPAAPDRAEPDLDGDIFASLDDDARFGNGVPEAGKASDIDFIQMTGITRPGPARTEAPAGELDPTAPLSFYEAGVADVDARARVNPADAARHSFDDDAPIDARANSAAEAFRALARQVGEATGPGGDLVEPEAPPAAPAPAASPATAEPAWDDEDLVEAITAWTRTPAETAVETPELLPEALPEPPADVDSPPGTDHIDSFDSEIEGIAEAPPAQGRPSPAPAKTVDLDRAPSVAERVAEAEALLQAAESQPRATPQSTAEAPAVAASPVAPAPPAPWPLPTAPPPVIFETEEADSATVDPEDPDGHIDFGNITGRRHYGRHFLKRSRRARRLIFALCVAAVVAVAGLAAYRHVLRPAVLSADQLARAAQRAVAAGRHDEASRYFQQLADRFPAHPNRPEALFDAGFFLQLPDRGKVAASPAQRAAAIGLLERFTREYPSDPRAARARALMGVLHADLGKFDLAIELLREPARQVDDPIAALPVLRKLAGAYRMQNLYRDAESTYLQAAALPKNFTPDADYYALGDMLQAEAALAGSAADRAALHGRALEYWTRAAESPGIDPVEREKIENQIKWLQTLRDDEGDANAVVAAPADIAPQAAPPPGPPRDDALRDGDPAAEAAYIERNAATAGRPGGE